MLSLFDLFPSVFFFVIAFGIVMFLILVIAMFTVFRVLRRSSQSVSEESGAIVKEREIIREIVKIRCPYCNNLYDEKFDKCPNCGGKRTP